MPPSAKGDVLSVKNLGPITEAKIAFGDLTVLVGPQASGKSILLQTLMLQLDAESIADSLHLNGFTWKSTETFLELYFGEGLGGLWGKKTKVFWNGKASSARALIARSYRGASAGASTIASVFYVPAQRVLTLKNGWPRHFGDYGPGDPFIVKDFSELLRELMEFGFGQERGVWFPRAEGLSAATQELLKRGIFGDFELKLEIKGAQKRLVLQQKDQNPLPFMVWSAGQREFSPLLVALYFLLGPGAERRKLRKWIVLEEPEMGLHPRAISAVLFLVLELIARGDRVCISTHSPHVLDLVWALRVLIEQKAPPEVVLKLFDVASSPTSKKIAAAILKKKLKVYSFNREGRPVTDISRLDPDSASPEEISWGGLTEFSARTADVVADFIAGKRPVRKR